MPCFRYCLHQSDEQRGGGRQGGMWHRHFLDICRVWLSREATPREPSGFEVCEAPGLKSQGDFICYLISNFSSVQDLNDVEPVCTGFSPAKVLSVSPLRGWGKGLSPVARPRQPLLQLLGFSWAVRGFGAFVPYRWSQTMVAPAPARAVLGSPAALCVHSEECKQPKFLRDLFLLAGKDGTGCPCPRPRKQQRNLVVPSWSSPGVYHTWDPARVPPSQAFGAGTPSPCIRTTLVGLFWRGQQPPETLHMPMLDSAPVLQRA